MGWMMGLPQHPSDLFNPEAWAANALSFGHDLPEMAGQVALLHIIAPGLGAAAGGKVLGSEGLYKALAAPGAWLDSAAQESMPHMAAKLGTSFFQGLTATQGVLASTMFVDGVGTALHEGASAKDAAIQGLVSAGMGAVLGTATHCGLTMLQNPLGLTMAGAQDASRAMNKQFSPLLEDLRNAAKDPSNPFVLQTTPTMTKIINMIDGVGDKPGWFSQKLMNMAQKLGEQQEMSYSDKRQARMVDVFGAAAKLADESYTGLERYQQHTEQGISALEASAAHYQDRMQSLLQHMKVNNDGLLNKPEFQNVVGMKLALAENFSGELSHLGPEQLPAPDPVGGMVTATRRELEKALKLLTPEEQVLAESMADIKKRTSDTQEALGAAKAAYTPEDAEATKNALMVYDWRRNMLSSRAQALSAKAGEHIDYDMFSHLLPSGMEPKNAAIQDEVTRTLDSSINELIKDGGYLASDAPDRLRQLVTQTSRTLLENTSAIKDPSRLLKQAASGLQEELGALKPPVPPDRPGPIYMDPAATDQAQLKKQAEYTAAMKQYELDKTKYDADLEDHHSRVQSLQAQLKPIQDRLTGEAVDLEKHANVQQNLLQQGASKTQTELEGNLRAAGVVPDKTGSTLAMLDKYYNPELASTEQVKAHYEKTKKFTNMKANPSPQYADVDQAIQRVTDAGKNYVRVDVPLSWVEDVSSSQQKVGAIEATKAIGKDLTKKPVILDGPQGVDSSLSVLDGKNRIAYLRKTGADSIPAYIPEDAWHEQLKSRLGGVEVAPGGQDVHSLATGAGESIQPAVHAGVMDHAQAVLNNQTPEQASQMVIAELNSIAKVYYGQINPSAVTLQRIYTDADGHPITMPSGLRSIGAALGECLEQVVGMKDTVQQWLQSKLPTDIKGMVSRTETYFRDWYHQHKLADMLGTQIPGFMQGKLEQAIKNDEIQLTAADKKYYLRNKVLPSGAYDESGKYNPSFSENLADAVQSMTKDGSKMDAMLAQHPGLRDIMGIYFDLMRVMEQYKVSSPDLESLFNKTAFPHRFPESLRILELENAKDKPNLALTNIIGEHQRNIPDLATARGMFEEAQKTALGSWQKFSDKATINGRLTDFLELNSEKQRAVTGLNQAGLNDLISRLALRNPVTDPVALIRGQITSVIKADATRNMLRQMAMLPIPGGGMHPEYNRPLTVMDHFSNYQKDENGEFLRDKDGSRIGNPNAPVTPPMVPSMLSKNNIPMVSLTSREFGLNPNDTIHFMGEPVKASELYMPQDVAKLFNEYYASGKIDPGAWNPILQATRTAALWLGGPKHLANIQANMMGQMASHSFQAIGESMGKMWQARGGLKSPEMMSDALKQFASGGKNLLTSWATPAQSAMAGEYLARNTTYMCDAILHGVNSDVWNTQVAGLARQVAQNVADPTTSVFPDASPPKGTVATFTDGVMNSKKSAGQTWEDLRHGQMLGIEKAADIAHLPFSAVKAMEHYTTFQPIQDALVGSYALWTHIHWNDMGQKLVAAGLPPDVALKVVKNEAAQMCNRNAGALPSYMASAKIRDAMYNRATGMLINSPGWDWAKAQAYTGILGDSANLHSTYAGMHEDSLKALRSYSQNSLRAQMATMIGGGMLTANLISAMVNGHSTFANDPGDPSAAFKLKIGDKLYPWGAGLINTALTATGRALQNPVAAPLHTAADLATPLPKAIYDVQQNMDWRGKPIYNPDKAPTFGQMGVNAYDAAKYIAQNSIDVQPLIGDPYHYQSPGEHVAEILGFKGSRAPTPQSEANRVSSEAQFQRNAFDKQAHLQVETYLQHPNADVRAEALQQFHKLADEQQMPGKARLKYIQRVAQGMEGTSDAARAIKSVPKSSRTIAERIIGELQ